MENLVDNPITLQGLEDCFSGCADFCARAVWPSGDPAQGVKVFWIDGLVGSGYLLGGRVEMLESENPVSNLMAGIIKLHVYMTPPSPAQEIDFALEYDASYVQSALQG